MERSLRDNFSAVMLCQQISVVLQCFVALCQVHSCCEKWVPVLQHILQRRLVWAHNSRFRWRGCAPPFPSVSVASIAQMTKKEGGGSACLIFLFLLVSPSLAWLLQLCHFQMEKQMLIFFTLQFINLILSGLCRPVFFHNKSGHVQVRVQHYGPRPKRPRFSMRAECQNVVYHTFGEH